MLSYRHAFHAGNFADVLKHVVLECILAYLTQKDKPLFFLDTHAGAGGYALGSKEALKNREFDDGIGRLWERQDLPPAVAGYVEVVREYNRDGRLARYPGSPFSACRRLRGDDRIVLCELHRAELEPLKRLARDDRRVTVVAGDGYRECIARMPPHERRGLVLIDPSYEIKEDYRQVVETLVAAHRRFATGVFALWYPVIERRRIDRLERELARSGIERIDLYELAVAPDSPGHGMTACGMVVINPPWTLRAEMSSALPWLADALGRDGGGRYRLCALGVGPRQAIDN